MNDPQVVWLLLMMCACRLARVARSIASRHNAIVWNCVGTILGTPRTPASSQVLSSLALFASGLGFRGTKVFFWIQLFFRETKIVLDFSEKGSQQL